MVPRVKKIYISIQGNPNLPSLASLYSLDSSKAKFVPGNPIALWNSDHVEGPWLFISFVLDYLFNKVEEIMIDRVLTIGCLYIWLL